MARYKDEQCRRCRREGQKLFLKGKKQNKEKNTVYQFDNRQNLQ